jgi:hypothetical protein
MYALGTDGATLTPGDPQCPPGQDIVGMTVEGHGFCGPVPPGKVMPGGTLSLVGTCPPGQSATFSDAGGGQMACVPGFTPAATALTPACCQGTQPGEPLLDPLGIDSLVSVASAPHPALTTPAPAPTGTSPWLWVLLAGAAVGGYVLMARR